MPEYQMPGKELPEYNALDSFTQGYIEAALFTNEESLQEEESTGGLDHAPGFEDFAPETLEKMIADCKSFQEKHKALLDAAVAVSDGGYEMAQAGRDFWFTRCGHGAGFWDRGLQQAGEDLTNVCGWRTEFPNVDLYIGDDKKIYA